MRKVIVMVWLAFLLTGIALMFWYTEWIYQLPTPVPDNYAGVQLGASIALQPEDTLDKPILLHFFNPDCPCSRFNVPHFKSLLNAYGDRVDFRIVLLSAKTYPKEKIRDKFGTDIAVLQDSAIARACGVYSTPQAVIIGTDHRLFYRGNYNKSRYCTDPKSEYVRIALDSLFNKGVNTGFDELALAAYGCQIPLCKSK